MEDRKLTAIYLPEFPPGAVTRILGRMFLVLGADTKEQGWPKREV